eukprot:CAMPEP_0116843338 /NCGR_PEP_ID=MMETSP0418-20121206/12031_1 /TAXON_ID=1158023 /ORGANISM="Astrosyne radiata, Strain 13vi08-1A" /LENGTH=151 /DNA_ID=CAMNT_0004474077 /DNA_START=1 /DNA_END=453 /DNA_ORIENTATION=-
MSSTRRDRSRSRSRSPEDEEDRRRSQLDRDRRARMARLRAENEAEERQLAVLEGKKQQQQQQKQRQERDLEGNQNTILLDPSEWEGLEEEEQMQRLLGFSGFGSTKGQAVQDNLTSASLGAVSKNKARKYRQYMNRKGGFNRPLDKMKNVV